MAGVMNKLKAAMSGYKRSPAEDPEDAQDQGADEGAEAEPMEDPRSASADGNTLYIDKSLFPDGCKAGDKVTITATVESMGTKYGVIPEEIKPANEQEQA